MKKVILILLALIICAGGIYIILYYNTDMGRENNNSIINDTSMINETNITNNENENSNTNNETNIATSKNNFKIVEVEETDFKSNYELEDPFEIINKDYFNVEKEEGSVVITLIESEQNKELIKDNEKVTYDEKYTISNVDVENVDKIFCGGEGQDLVYPLVYILQKDGTVKGVDIKNGYNTGKFVAYDISGLENIQRIEQVSVTPVNDSGYEAIVAISEDESVYEIRYEE